MKAQDVMTTRVVSVGPGQGTREVARILRDKGISAVPVVDDDGRPLGMVSEGDLIGRDEGDREARRDVSRAVLAWRLSNTLGTEFCVDALEEALSEYGRPEIFNTDQGSQFTSDDFTDT